MPQPTASIPRWGTKWPMVADFDSEPIPKAYTPPSLSRTGSGAGFDNGAACHPNPHVRRKMNGVAYAPLLDHIGKSSKRVSNQPGEFFYAGTDPCAFPLPIPYTTSYVILLLPQLSDFSPPSNLSGPNVPVSVFHLTDCISVRPTKLIGMHSGLLIDSNIPPERFK
jgi:hypothetical protein